MHAPRHQRAFSLIEALITLFVFAIGILTVVGLQLISKKTNFDAAQRTTAAMLANDIAERMRANLAQNGAALADYLVEDLGTTSSADTTPTLSEPAQDCTAAECTRDQMAAWDLYEWEQSLVGAAEDQAGGLSEPNACIRSDDTDGGAAVYHIIVAWRGVSALSNPSIDQDLVDAHPEGCGEGNDKFADDDTGAADVYRRVIVVSTYITP